VEGPDAHTQPSGAPQPGEAPGPNAEHTTNLNDGPTSPTPAITPLPGATIRFMPAPLTGWPDRTVTPTSIAHGVAKKFIQYFATIPGDKVRADLFGDFYVKNPQEKIKTIEHLLTGGLGFEHKAFRVSACLPEENAKTQEGSTSPAWYVIHSYPPTTTKS
jgi:hypothetical protein